MNNSHMAEVNFSKVKQTKPPFSLSKQHGMAAPCLLVCHLLQKSVYHLLESQPRNQPVNVGGSKPCFMMIIGVLLSLPEGSVSRYILAKKRGKGI